MKRLILLPAALFFLLVASVPDLGLAEQDSTVVEYGSHYHENHHHKQHKWYHMIHHKKHKKHHRHHEERCREGRGHR